jgi:hypothetical protein
MPPEGDKEPDIIRDQLGLQGEDIQGEALRDALGSPDEVEIPLEQIELEELLPEEDARDLLETAEELVRNLKIIIVRTSFRKYYAGYTTNDDFPEDWPTGIGLERIIEDDKGIIEIPSSSIKFANNKENPFGDLVSARLDLSETKKLIFQETSLRMVEEKGIVSRKELLDEIRKIDPGYKKGTFDGNINNTSRGSETPRVGENAVEPYNSIMNTKYKITDSPTKDSAAICHVEFNPDISTDEEFRNFEYRFTQAEWENLTFTPNKKFAKTESDLSNVVIDEEPTEYVEQIFFKDVTPKGDFLQGIYGLRKPDRGGGQTYFDIASSYETDQMDATIHEFLEYAEIIDYPTAGGGDRPSYKFEAYELGGNKQSTQICIAPRTRDRYKISKTNTEIHPAWTGKNGFPTLPLEFTKWHKDPGENILLYGVPGSGKSWTIENKYREDDDVVERVVFHPDYTYSDFIGQILPFVGGEGGTVSYRFQPGPFTKVLRDATQNPRMKYILIIEEVNRGNAPAIFGDVFQLLDRKTEANDNGWPLGSSEYGITNADIAKAVYGSETEEVKIPSNLWLLGTMNTSDQNVFTLDTAFQRRWKMKMIDNRFEATHDFADDTIRDTGLTWKKFCTTINETIVGSSTGMTSTEDKRLGKYFVQKKDLEGDGFAEKVIKYLWDDAFKFNRSEVFDNTKFPTLEDVIRAFNKRIADNRLVIFNEELKTKLVPVPAGN